jgi:hypothetical protein
MKTSALCWRKLLLTKARMILVPVVPTPLTSTLHTSFTTMVMTCSSRLSSLPGEAEISEIEADIAKTVAEEEAVEEEAVKEEAIKKEGVESSTH